MSEESEEIKVFAFTIESTEIETTAEEFAGYAYDLGYAYDSQLSNMDGETFIVSPEGLIINPYGRRVDLMDKLRPILDLIELGEILRYVEHRKFGEA